MIELTEMLLCHCAEMVGSARERKLTAADVTEDIRSKLEDLLVHGMVISATVDEMNSLLRLLLAHNQHRLV